MERALPFILPALLTVVVAIIFTLSAVYLTHASDKIKVKNFECHVSKYKWFRTEYK